MGFIREQRKHRSKENRWYPTTEARSCAISLQVTRDKNKDRPENWWNYTIFLSLPTIYGFQRNVLIPLRKFIPPRFGLLIFFLIFIPFLDLLKTINLIPRHGSKLSEIQIIQSEENIEWTRYNVNFRIFLNFWTKFYRKKVKRIFGNFSPSNKLFLHG